MANEITKDQVPNRWEDYKLQLNDAYKTKIMTTTNGLNEQEKEIVDIAINKSWVNPRFKMKYFQAEEQITPFHKLRQLFMELRVQEEAIENVEFLLKKLPTELELAKLRVERAEDEIEKKEWELKVLELERDIQQAYRRVKQNYIERHQYVDLINEFLESDENKTPDGKSLLTAFDTPLEDEYEKQYWISRLAKQASMDLIAYGQISAGNLSAILDLTQDMQNDILAIAHNFSIQMKNHSDSIRNDVAKALGVETPDNRIELVPPQSPSPRRDQNDPSTLNTNGENLEDVYNI